MGPVCVVRCADRHKHGAKVAQTYNIASEWEQDARRVWRALLPTASHADMGPGTRYAVHAVHRHLEIPPRPVCNPPAPLALAPLCAHTPPNCMQPCTHDTSHPVQRAHTAHFVHTHSTAYTHPTLCAQPHTPHPAACAACTHPALRAHIIFCLHPGLRSMRRPRTACTHPALHAHTPHCMRTPSANLRPAPSHSPHH